MSKVPYAERTVPSQSDGNKLFVRQWTSPNKKTPSQLKAQLVLVHGYLEHSGRYLEFAEYLCETMDMSVTVYDLRGHGQSEGVRGYVSHYDLYHDDLETVLSEFTTDDSPRFVLGHSNGGMVSLLHYASNSPYKGSKKEIRGLITTSAFVAPAGELPWISVKMAQILGYVLPTVRMAAVVDDSDMTHDEELVDARKSDPTILHHFTLGWGRASLTEQARAREITQIDLPLLYFWATDDKIADPAAVAKVGEQIQSPEKTVVCRDGEYHEILNEVKRKETYKVISDWIEKHI